MTFNIQHAPSLSRGELLLRTFFGIIYIYIPHGFVLLFLTLWGFIVSFISFWVILFTAQYPKSFFDYQVNLLRWELRVRARQFNLTDGYPAFGLTAVDPAIVLDVPYPEKLSRSLLLVKFFFGLIYVIIPHGFILFFVGIAVVLGHFIAWWIILFTGELPMGMHNFLVGFMRWTLRVQLYMLNMTDVYPPFTLR